jgi:hypothetical protein
MYRVLGGNRTNPCAGTRDDDARARTNAEHLVIEGSGQLFSKVPGPTNTGPGQWSRAPANTGPGLMARAPY